MIHTLRKAHFYAMYVDKVRFNISIIINIITVVLRIPTTPIICYFIKKIHQQIE